MVSCPFSLRIEYRERGCSMGRADVTLTRIEGDHRITPSSDPEFLCLLKRGLLMLLREQGIFNDGQLRMALERLGGVP